MKRPSFQFYPGDWMRDSALRSCSVGARGLWMDMLCLMHEGTPYGYLKVNLKVILPPNLARIVGATLPETEGWLSELEDAGVFSRDEEGSIFSRRMIRDESIRESRACGGKLGGNPALKDNPKVGKKVNLTANLQPTPSSSSSSSNASKVDGASAKPAKPRVRNLHLDTLATLNGAKLEEVTPGAFSAAAKALADIRQVCPDVTPDEIQRRAKNLSLSWGGKPVSANALAKWWGDADKMPQKAGAVALQSADAKPKPVFVQIKELESQIWDHPANPNALKSRVYDPKWTGERKEADRAELKALRAKLEALQQGQTEFPNEP